MKSWGCHKTKILFLTKYVCRSSVDFLGPIGERYAGLYYSFMEQFRFAYDFYWRTGDGETFEYQPDSNTLRPSPTFAISQSPLSLVRVLLSFCVENLKSRKIFVVSYPYFPRSKLLAILLICAKAAYTSLWWSMFKTCPYLAKLLGRRAI